MSLDFQAQLHEARRLAALERHGKAPDKSEMSMKQKPGTQRLFQNQPPVSLWYVS